MDSGLLKFIRGDTNYYKGEMSIGRDPTCGKGADYYIVKKGDFVIFTFWGNPEKKKKSQDQNEESDKPPKKSMGGKKPYTMLMSEQTGKVRELLSNKKITAEQYGYFMALADHIEWGTGRLVDKKTKKPLRAKDIGSMLGISERSWYNYAKPLKENGLLSSDKGGYHVSQNLLKKAGVKNGKQENREQNNKK